MGTGGAPRAAVVAGGTGLVGGTLLQLLGADASYQPVTSLVRREVPAPPGVALRLVNFERLDEVALTEVEDAFCCLGTTRRAAGSDAAFRRVDLDYVVAFARLVKRAGARRFLLVSSLGASPSSPFLYPRTKGECEAAVGDWVHDGGIVRPSFLVGARARGTSCRSGCAAPRATCTALSSSAPFGGTRRRTLRRWRGRSSAPRRPLPPASR